MPITSWANTSIDGVKIRYPAEWSAETQESEEGTSVYLTGEDVTFAVIGVYPDTEVPEDIVSQILDSLREEHPGLEIHDREVNSDRFDEGSAEEGLFMTLDTVGYCWVQSWKCGGHCVVVYVQSIQPEAAEAEELFAQLCDFIADEN